MDVLACTLVSGGVGAVALGLRRRRRRRRAHRSWLCRIARGDVELPLEVGHLSPALAQLTVHARTLRLSLQTPVVRCIAAPWIATPWGRRQICDEYDLAIVDARRALWEWIGEVKRLPPADRVLLTRLGVDLQPVGLVFARPDLLDRTGDPWDDVMWPRTPDFGRISEQLASAVEALSRFEITLLLRRPDPYR